MPAQDFELLKFPTVYPIKVVCRRTVNVRESLSAIVRRHWPDLTDAAISERDSNKGNFVAISYAVMARDAAHVTALVAELRAHDDVVMVI